MHLKSLGLQTNLIFARFNGEIIDRETYLVVKTPSNPEYFWGNFLVFDRPPREGDLAHWKKIFDFEFDYYDSPQHYTFTWDIVEDNELISKDGLKEFKNNGFDLEKMIALSTDMVNSPPYLNKGIEIRKIKSASDWERIIQLQILCADEKYKNEFYEKFKRGQFANYKKMTEAGRGEWFGAFLNGELVGDLGVFFEHKVARYQSVETHPGFRNQGIAGTLVFKAGEYALENWAITDLVMEADPDYHAARIYESVGFKSQELTYSLTWWKGKR